MTQTVLAQFKTESGEDKGAQVELPTNLRPNELQEICDALLQTPQAERVPYMFFVKGSHVTDTIATTKDENDKPIMLEQERVLEIVFAPQAIFRVEPVTRCVSDMPGHGEAIVSASFSPDGKGLVSGSGDKSVRFWDTNTQTPVHTCLGHQHWVLAVAWSPDAEKVASGCKNGDVNIWCPKTGQRLTKNPMIGHSKYITCLAWEPINCKPDCRRLASSSKDSTIRIWDTVLQRCEMVLSGHSMSVTCIKWSANGLIYSASQDRSVKVWRGSDGVMCRSLDGHAHWVNTLALNCEYVVRTGPFDPENRIKSKQAPSSRLEMAQVAQERYDKARSGPIKEDMLVSGSDDFTMFLWSPEGAKKPVARLTGHQQLINDVKFSPDMRYIASASFDKSIRLWNGKTGKFIATLRGHVQRVYQLAWSADSRLLASSSADSTCKVWSIGSKKLLNDLPGHSDEVYVVDWSPDGVYVVSGGKDKILKVWRK
uniref:Notchless 1 n=1 Tax=Aceria tosichella TaxID=561515 RepID=A0A6G1SB36_9ACAR